VCASCSHRQGPFGQSIGWSGGLQVTNSACERQADMSRGRAVDDKGVHLGLLVRSKVLLCVPRAAIDKDLLASQLVGAVACK